MRPCDIADSPKGMVNAVRGTVVLRTGYGAVRQNHSETEHSIRRIAVPEFAAAVLRAHLEMLVPEDAERTIFANRDGGPFSPFNVRRTFRTFLAWSDSWNEESRCAGTGGPGQPSSPAGPE